jgi:hypothetical protein
MKSSLYDILQSHGIITVSGKLTSKSIFKILKLGLDVQVVEETNFLPPASSLSERLYCILHSITTQVYCKSCGNPIIFNEKGYSTYCSRACSVKDTNERRRLSCIDSSSKKTLDDIEKAKERRHTTNILRYGEDYKDKHQEKIKKTNVLRYGVESLFQLKDFQTSIKTRMKSKYGVEHALQVDEFKEKQQQTLFKNYGVLNPSFSEEIINKKNIKFIEKYGAQPLCSGTSVRKTIEETILKKYGVDNPFKSKNIQEQIKITNRKKYGRDFYNQRHISQESLDKLQDVEWLTEEHHSNGKTLIKIANELGVSGNCVQNYFNQHNIKIKRLSTSKGEDDICQFLDENNILYERNTRLIIPPKEIDIFLPDYNIGIEYCGLYWHSDLFRDKNYHYNKWKMCYDKKIRLFTIFEDVWENNQDKIKNKILYACFKFQPHKIYARQCNITELSFEESKKFFNATHIQGMGRSSVTYGLCYDNEIVAAMSFLRQGDLLYEINRYSTSCHVIGGFSKILSNFLKNRECNKLYTYADLEYSIGHLYEANKFVLNKIVPPTYFYVIEGKRKHRAMFRRKYLRKFLGDGFIEEETEFENMNNNNILRVWNCGLLKYTLNREDFNAKTSI